MVGALMHELEVILHEYLSFNWDCLDCILAANQHLLAEEGPQLPSPRLKDAIDEEVNPAAAHAQGRG